MPQVTSNVYVWHDNRHELHISYCKIMMKPDQFSYEYLSFSVNHSQPFHSEWYEQRRYRYCVTVNIIVTGMSDNKMSQRFRFSVYQINNTKMVTPDQF